MKLSILSVTLALLAVAGAAPVEFEKRRFGQEHTPRADATFQAMKDISVGTGFEAQLGDLSGAAVRALLAKADKCEQQNVADQCVDIAHEIGVKFASSFGPQKESDLIEVCKEYRTLERNTPNEGQPSELCDKPPKNKELEDLVQEQDPGFKPTTTTSPEEEPTTPPEEEEPTTPPEKEEPTTPPEKEEPTTPPEEEEPTTPPEEKPTQPSEEEKPCVTTTVYTTVTDTGAESTPTTPASESDVNNEAFTDPVGGVQMPLIKKLDPSSGANFEVNGSKFQNIGAAHNRQCDVQHNLCFNKFNGGDRSFSGADCDNQNNVCKAGDPVFSN